MQEDSEPHSLPLPPPFIEWSALQQVDVCQYSGGIYKFIAIAIATNQADIE